MVALKLAALFVPLALLSALAPPAQAADPLCDPACTIDQNGLAYLPPIALAPSGSEVTFAALDTAHYTVEGTGVGGGASPCFGVVNTPSVEAPAVRVTVRADGVYAEVLDGKGLPAKRCAAAMDAGGIAFVLPYHCLLHPTMRGALLVTA